MITCLHGGSRHSHTSVYEARVFHGFISAPVAPAPPVVPVRYATDKQIRYVVDVLGGDESKARKLTVKECSTYIDELKRRPKVTVPTSAESESDDTAAEIKATSKSKMIESLISMVPDGYFAVRQQDGAPITFMRVNRPVNGKYRGGVKVQSQHGPALEIRWVRWPSGQVSRYHWFGHDIEDYLLMLLADWKGAAHLYAEKKKKCGRCNTDLTDPRSRFYLIGPECEKHWPFWLDDVAEAKNGYWEQQPVEVQEKYTSDLEYR